MFFKLDNLGWFYRGKMEQNAALPESLDHNIIYYTLATFTVVGFLTIFATLVQSARLILSLFILPGTPVYLFVSVNALQSD